jgi:hypothetical protein
MLSPTEWTARGRICPRLLCAVLRDASPPGADGPRAARGRSTSAREGGSRNQTGHARTTGFGIGHRKERDDALPRNANSGCPVAAPISMLTFNSMPLWLPPTQRNRRPPPPGPSPWYLSSPAAQIHAADGAWTWINDPKLSGVCHLFSPHDQAVLTVDFYCYVEQLQGDRLLIWREEGRQPPNASLNPKIAFDLLTLAALAPVQNAELAGTELKANKQRLRYEGGHPIRYELLTSVEPGIHAIATPTGVRGAARNPGSRRLRSLPSFEQLLGSHVQSDFRFQFFSPPARGHTTGLVQRRRV